MSDSPTPPEEGNRDDIPFPDDASEPAAGREPGSDDDTPMPEGFASSADIPFPDDDAPLPEERDEAPVERTRDTRSISERARAGSRPPSGDQDYLRGLNPEQRDAVLTTEGPVLVLAGAGTGKTAALTARLAHLLFTRKAWPSEILAVTFTNKAAREMRERVGRLVGEAVEGMPWLGTFHAIGASHTGKLCGSYCSP